MGSKSYLSTFLPVFTLENCLILRPQRRLRSSRLLVHESSFCVDWASLTLLQKNSLGRIGNHSRCPIEDTSWAVWHEDSLYSGLWGMQDMKAATCWCSGPSWGCVDLTLPKTSSIACLMHRLEAADGYTTPPLNPLYVHLTVTGSVWVPFRRTELWPTTRVRTLP